ncbi:VOC family protein [Pelagicoccus sp. SDUM812002]|uniref:VOC family protein n=1 Tax=Pelagicoccus sp. SDUM812002 TaxID=3041266 RepID=UPI00280F309B|nr:VOC family protein [Pelagicoccus sp. SDUM812002]MDQ8186825.1 VOC family protein [Pelagicoccus sp. SDUM812002]
MKNRTVTITVSASVDEVFSFLSNPETLPLWAVSFCGSVHKKDERWTIRTPQGGELAFAIDADRSSGCIEMLAGPTLELVESFPMRVFKADNGQTAASFTMFKSQRPDMTDTLFDLHYRGLVREVGTLVERFGGGDLSSGLPDEAKLCMGIVSDKLSETRDFYVSYFGFKAVFDAPCYLHLLGPEGEQLGVMASASEAGQPEFEAATAGDGLWISLTVECVDAAFSHLKAEGLLFREEPTDQPWGERTCVTVDPNGVLIHLSQPIGLMDDSLKQYVREPGAELVV